MQSDSFMSSILFLIFLRLHCTYEALTGGPITEALTDLTGGLFHTYDITDCAQEDLLIILVLGYADKSLLGCGTREAKDGEK